MDILCNLEIQIKVITQDKNEKKRHSEDHRVNVEWKSIIFSLIQEDIFTSKHPVWQRGLKSLKVGIGFVHN